jgi:hypothetical protein
MNEKFSKETEIVGKKAPEILEMKSSINQLNPHA